MDTRPVAFTRKDCGPRHVGEAASHVAARRQKWNDMQEVSPSPQTHLLRDTLYPIRTSELLATWLTELQHQPEHPTAEQLMLLKTIVDRIAFEAAAEQSETTCPSTATRTPVFDMVHGQPGCGKSRLIAWIREAFESVLGWQHGIHFVCLTFQKTIAVQIAGETIHQWSGIPVAEGDTGNGEESTETRYKMPVTALDPHRRYQYGIRPASCPARDGCQQSRETQQSIPT